MNRGIITAIATIGLAQFLKIPIKNMKTGEWDWGTFIETGGMPSSHSAGVMSLATFIALKRGITTIDFALASVFGLIVMYDAQGIRRQTGELTLVVNDIDEELEHIRGQSDYHFHDRKERRLKEMLGHQPKEVLGGALLGILTGTIAHCLSKK